MKPAKAPGFELEKEETRIIQINLGYLCNQRCLHCHHDASPESRVLMDDPTFEKVMDAAASSPVRDFEFTGGAPELHPRFREALRRLSDAGKSLLVRTNLTALLIEGNDDLIDLFRELRVRIAASLPCYTLGNVDAQRGAGVFEGSIEALRRLNAAGYGQEEGLILDLVYNPAGPYLPPVEETLAEDYRRELGDGYGIVFDSLVTIAGAPIGRFRRLLGGRKLEEYGNLLIANFNPRTLDSVMCLHLISVGPDGRVYDCDFNQALGLEIPGREGIHFWDLRDISELGTMVAVGEHCLTCTAGAGSSCHGALEKDHTA